jgi:rhodanese-related sulfurtransferase
VREPGDFALRHLAGSLNVGLSGRFASWVGTLVEPGRPLVVVADPGREEEAVTRLGRIGFDSMEGYLDGGIEAVREREEALASVRRLSAVDLESALAADGDGAPRVLDVRALFERQESHIPGSLHIPLPELPRRVNEIPRDRPVVVQCRSGFRSMIAASILEAHGFAGVGDLEGGILDWDRTVEAP